MNRKHLTGLLFVAATFVFCGCDVLDKADDVTFDATIEVSRNADENGEGTNVLYENLETVELSDNAEIAKYASKIKSIKINKITYSVENYNAAPHNSQVFFNEGIASFAAVGASTHSVIVPFAASATGVNLQGSTSETELDIDADGLNELAGLLKEDNQLIMSTTGTLSITPVSFTVVSKFYLTITANALD
jgi:hypothetical protein